MKEFLQCQSLKDTLYLEKNAYGYKLVSMCEAGAATGFQPEGARIFFGTKLFQELGTNIKEKDQHLRKKIQNSKKRNKT